MSIKEQLAESNPEAILYDGFDEALIGTARRCGQPTLAVYDYDLAVELLMRRDGLTWEEAVDHLEYNVVGGWHGPNTPVFLEKPDER